MQLELDAPPELAHDPGSATAPESPFGRCLREHAHLPVFFEPLSGNHGDTLIRLGTEHLLDKLGFERVEKAEDAGLIVVNGGGAMNDIWRFGIDTFGHWRAACPDTPIVIGPSSFRFKGIDFAEVCRRGSGPLAIFAREEKSLDILCESGAGDVADLMLSRDIAFELRDSDFVAGLRERVANTPPKHTLIGMRRDSESNAGGALGGLMVQGKFWWLPGPIRKPLARLRDRIAARRSLGEAGGDGEVLTPMNAAKLGTEWVPAAKGLQRVYEDASIVETFDGFVDLIVDAGLVVTDRLHVSVLSYLIGRPAVMLPGNNHKLAGVFALTMNHQGSPVRLMTKHGLRGGGETLCANETPQASW